MKSESEKMAKSCLTLSPPAFWYYVKHREGEEKAHTLGIALRAVKNDLAISFQMYSYVKLNSKEVPFCNIF